MGWDFDSLGDRQKFYEQQDNFRNAKPYIPTVARLDGRAFHKFCKGLEKPFDWRFCSLMAVVTKELMNESNACCGYTQSDEITLIFQTDDPKSSIYFGGRIFKMISQLAAFASVSLNRHLGRHLSEKKDMAPTFDCRVFELPSLKEGVNNLVWREQDATRNSIQSAAQAHFSHNEVMNKNQKELIEMLYNEKGVNWNDYPPFFKRGTFVRKKKIKRQLNEDELAELPEKHHARQFPDMEFERNIFVEECLPPLTKVTNPVDTIFYGDEPKTYDY